MPITLVPLAAEHLPDLQGLVTQADLAMVAANPDAIHFRAVLDGENCVGMVGLNRVGDPHIVAAIRPAERRKGYAMAAVEEMARFAFEELELPEIYAICEPGSPSNGLVTKAGYIFVLQQGNNRYYRLPKGTWHAAQPPAAPQVVAGPLVADGAAAEAPALDKAQAKEA